MSGNFIAEKKLTSGSSNQGVDIRWSYIHFCLFETLLVLELIFKQVENDEDRSKRGRRYHY